MRVNPLPARAHGTAACKTPCSWQLVRGTQGVEFGAMLPEVQMPPLLLQRVVNWAELPALRASELAARLEVLSQSFNSRPPTSISLLTTFHPLPKPSALLKRTLASIAQNLPSRSGEHQLSLPWPKATHPKFPPNACRGERCGLWGAKPPSNQFPHRLKTSRSLNLLPGGQPHLAGGDRRHGKGERLRTTPICRMGRRALPPPNRVPVTEYYIGF